MLSDLIVQKVYINLAITLSQLQLRFEIPKQENKNHCCHEFIFLHIQHLKYKNMRYCLNSMQSYQLAHIFLDALGPDYQTKQLSFRQFKATKL